MNFSKTGTAALLLLTVAVLYRPLLVLSFNSTKAALLGMRPGFTHVAMMPDSTL